MTRAEALDERQSRGDLLGPQEGVAGLLRLAGRKVRARQPAEKKSIMRPESDRLFEERHRRRPALLGDGAKPLREDDVRIVPRERAASLGERGGELRLIGAVRGDRGIGI